MEQKKYTVYIHKVNTENGPMYYTGVTHQKISRRWNPSAYKGTSLLPYIENYGWNNIEHVVMLETDDREKAYKTEDLLILGYASIGRNINRQRSGHIEVSDPNGYMRDKRANDPEWAELCRKRIRDKRANDHEYAEREHQYKRQYRQNRRANDHSYVEHERQYDRKRRARPEYKIYQRVKNFNRYYPDHIVESPLEAKRKYIESGGTIIPQYIKHDDL